MSTFIAGEQKTASIQLTNPKMKAFTCDVILIIGLPEATRASKSISLLAGETKTLQIPIQMPAFDGMHRVFLQTKVEGKEIAIHEAAGVTTVAPEGVEAGEVLANLVTPRITMFPDGSWRDRGGDFHILYAKPDSYYGQMYLGQTVYVPNAGGIWRNGGTMANRAIPLVTAGTELIGNLSYPTQWWLEGLQFSSPRKRPDYPIAAYDWVHNIVFENLGWDANNQVQNFRLHMTINNGLGQPFKVVYVVFNHIAYATGGDAATGLETPTVYTGPLTNEVKVIALWRPNNWGLYVWAHPDPNRAFDPMPGGYDAGWAGATIDNWKLLWSQWLQMA